MSCCNSCMGCEGSRARTAIPLLQVAVMEAETSNLPRVTLWESQWVGVLGRKQSRYGEWEVLCIGDGPGITT